MGVLDTLNQALADVAHALPRVTFNPHLDGTGDLHISAGDHDLSVSLPRVATDTYLRVHQFWRQVTQSPDTAPVRRNSHPVNLNQCFLPEVRNLPHILAQVTGKDRTQNETGQNALAYLMAHDPEATARAVEAHRRTLQTQTTSSPKSDTQQRLNRLDQAVRATVQQVVVQQNPSGHASVQRFACGLHDPTSQRLRRDVVSLVVLHPASVRRTLPESLQPRPTLLTTQDRPPTHLVMPRESETGDDVPEPSMRETERDVVARERVRINWPISFSPDGEETRFPRVEEIFASPVFHTAPMARFFVPPLSLLTATASPTNPYPVPAVTGRNFPRSFTPRPPIYFTANQTPPPSGPFSVRPAETSESPIGQKRYSENPPPRIPVEERVAWNHEVPCSEETPPDRSSHTPSTQERSHRYTIAANDNVVVGDLTQPVFVGTPPLYSAPRTSTPAFARFVPANNNADGQVPGVADTDGNPSDHSGDHANEDGEFAQSNQQNGQNPHNNDDGETQEAAA